MPQAYGELLARLEGLPQVRRAATTSHLPMGGNSGDWMVDVEGYELPAGRSLLSPDFRIVSEGLFDALGIPLRQGRTFGGGDRAEGPHAIVVSEAGASVYSASEYASQEMPGVDVSLRGAASIARRLQDPLAELVKIDPKSIGVGQY